MAEETRRVGGIHKKMLKVMELVGGIAKNRSGQGINYKFRGIDDLYGALHPALRDAGVAMYPVMLPGTWKREQREGQRQGYNGQEGKKFVNTMVSFDLQVQFVDVDDGSNVFVIVPAEGSDDSDKAAGKAMSYGMKNALFHALAIPTEDPDAERPEVPATGDAPAAKKGRAPRAGSVAAATQAAAAPAAESKPATQQATVTELRAAAASDEAMVETINACKTEAELNAFIDTTLRALPGDKQLEMAKHCKARRTKGFAS